MAYDGLYIWVANQEAHTVSKMLAATGERVASFGVGNRPVALANIRKNLWVVQRRDGTVSKLQLSDGAHLGTFSVGKSPEALAYDGTYVWVANFEDNSVTRLQEVDGAQTGTFSIGDGPVDILFDGSHIWVALEGDRSLHQLNPDGSIANTYALGIGPHSFLFDGTYFWVTYRVNAIPAAPETRVLQVRAVDGTLINDIGTGVIGSIVTIRADITHSGPYLWVSSPNTINDSFVTRLETANPSSLVNFPICEGPSTLLYTGSVWVACQNDDLIQKVPGDGSVVAAPIQTHPVPSPAPGKFRQFLPIVTKK